MDLYFVPGVAMNPLQVDFESNHWLVLIPTKTMTQGRSSPIRAFICNGKNNQYQYDFFCSVDIVPRNPYSTHCLRLITIALIHGHHILSYLIRSSQDVLHLGWCT